MAIYGQVSREAEQQNSAREALKIAIERLCAAASAPSGTATEIMRTLDNYLDAQKHPKRY